MKKLTLFTLHVSMVVGAIWLCQTVPTKPIVRTKTIHTKPIIYTKTKTTFKTTTCRDGRCHKHVTIKTKTQRQ